MLFRDGKGRPGVLGAYCAHRRANLCLGTWRRGVAVPVPRIYSKEQNVRDVRALADAVLVLKPLAVCLR